MNETVKFAAVAWGPRTVAIEYQWVGVADPQAPLVVFLHEGLGSVSMWQGFPARLCEQLQCRGLVYSRPGYGRSTPRPAGEHWEPDFMHRQACEVLPELLRTLRVDSAQEQVWLLGHSDGGSIALLFAAHFPEALQGAVVMAPHIMVEDLSIQSIAAARSAYLETQMRDRLQRYHADPDSAFWGWNDVWLSPAFRQWTIETELDRITCPLLAVQGVDDAYGTLSQIRRIRDFAPQCELLELSDCAHSPHRDQPDRLIHAVQHFYQRQQLEIHP